MWEFQVQLNLGKNKDWSPEDSISDGSEKLLLEGKGGARLYRSFATNGRSSECQLVLLSKETRYVSLRSLALFFVQEDARVWVYWNHSFDLHLRYLGPVSWVFISWVSSGLNVGSGYRLMTARWQIVFPAWFPSGLTSSPSVIGCNHVKKLQSCKEITSVPVISTQLSVNCRSPVSRERKWGHVDYNWFNQYNVFKSSLHMMS